MLDKEKYKKLFETKNFEKIVDEFKNDYLNILLLLLNKKNLKIDETLGFSFILDSCIANFDDLKNILIFIKTIFYNEDEISDLEKIDILMEQYKYIYDYYKEFNN